MTRSGIARPLRDGALLAIDQGTTNTKAMLLDASTGLVLAEASAPTSIAFPAPGWVEQDAERLWTATMAAVDGCLEQQPEARVVGIGISNQRETVVCWSRSTGRALGPALGWQDARTTAWCADLLEREPSAAQTIRQRTGLSLDPMFSAPKFRTSIDAAVAGGADPTDVAVGTVDAWLVWRLTGQHVTELGNASRTLLLDLASLAWHDDLLSLFGIDAARLPEPRPSDASFGVTSTRHGRLPAGVPVLAVLADSHAALYHHGCTTPGTGKATYGTGTSVMSPTKDPSAGPHGIATTVAWHVGGAPTYAREGNIVASGSALDWMASTLGVPEGTAGGAHLTALAGEVPDSGGVCFVPAFSGLGAPYWDRSAVGVLVGVSGGTTRGHLARAALEAVAHQVTDVVEAMESDGSARIDTLHADGGATASGLLMQVQADLLGRPLEVASSPAASALGAARLAAEHLGVATPPAEPGHRVAPHPPTSSDAGAARRSWRQAIARSRGLTVSQTDPTLRDETIERNDP
ncbi:FGGY-family carbohydrate kinase [Terrabacter terrae]|uniref:ATP:glycerol 3-phosphotransferase n=1 Tax=Terrabacter terrae TaxID=318434 RepID=A0ABN2TS70_9MICO